jgi:transcriptional regulator with XRE-family HTH domain
MLLIARRAAGISQRELGRQVRVSHNKIRRVERGEPGQLTMELAAKLGAVLGLQFSASLHPDGDPIRDAAHAALLKRFRARVRGSLIWRTEVPMPIEGDRRSADGVVEGPTFAALVEAETRIDDVQALERKVRSKQRDMGISRVILVVGDTRHNRSVLRAVPGLREAFPLSTRACLAALERGLDPGSDALVFI